MAQETGTRDIEQDLALCEKATPGPWQARQIVSTVGPMQMLAANGWEILGMTEDGMPLADWFERKEDAFQHGNPNTHKNRRKDPCKKPVSNILTIRGIQSPCVALNAHKGANTAGI